MGAAAGASVGWFGGTRVFEADGVVQPVSGALTLSERFQALDAHVSAVLGHMALLLPSDSVRTKLASCASAWLVWSFCDWGRAVNLGMQKRTVLELV
jgi:hypothetical protein